jgi:hypothetical protein
MSLHNSRGRVTVRAELEMSDFVGYDTTQNDGDLELGVVTPCESIAERILASQDLKASLASLEMTIEAGVND